MYRTGADILAQRVRLISTAALIVTPLVSIYHFGLFFFNGTLNVYNLGFGVAMLIWGATFISPRKLSHYSNTKKQKVIGFILLCFALFSALIWFPLNEAITKS